MARKISKKKKQTRIAEPERAPKRKANAAQILLAVFAILIILSMVISAVSKL